MWIIDINNLASLHDDIKITVVWFRLLYLYSNIENESTHSVLFKIVTKYCNLLEIMLMYTFSNLQLL